MEDYVCWLRWRDLLDRRFQHGGWIVVIVPQQQPFHHHNLLPPNAHVIDYELSSFVLVHCYLASNAAIKNDATLPAMLTANAAWRGSGFTGRLPWLLTFHRKRPGSELTATLPEPPLGTPHEDIATYRLCWRVSRPSAKPHADLRLAELE